MTKTSKCVRGIATAAVAALMLTACNRQNDKIDEAPAAQTTNGAGMRIAFVEVDSLMTQYEFCKEYSLILQKKSNNARNTLAQKGQALQSAAESFQQKLNNNGFTSREQAEGVQANLQRQQANLQELQGRLSRELDEETAKYNGALRDSLQHFLARYNKTKKYDLIISKAGDNILFADKRYDITADVVAGLNKAYKKIAKK